MRWSPKSSYWENWPVLPRNVCGLTEKGPTGQRPWNLRFCLSGSLSSWSWSDSMCHLMSWRESDAELSFPTKVDLLVLGLLYTSTMLKTKWQKLQCIWPVGRGFAIIYFNFLPWAGKVLNCCSITKSHRTALPAKHFVVLELGLNDCPVVLAVAWTRCEIRHNLQTCWHGQHRPSECAVTILVLKKICVWWIQVWTNKWPDAWIDG